jgi:hypothetical protein
MVTTLPRRALLALLLAAPALCGGFNRSTQHVG